MILMIDYFWLIFFVTALGRSISLEGLGGVKVGSVQHKSQPPCFMPFLA